MVQLDLLLVRFWFLCAYIWIMSLDNYYLEITYEIEEKKNLNVAVSERKQNCSFTVIASFILKT